MNVSTLWVSDTHARAHTQNIGEVSCEVETEMKTEQSADNLKSAKLWS